MKKLFSLLALTALFAIAAFADIRPPEKPKPKTTPNGNEAEMFIQVSNEVTEPTLVIKKSALNKLGAALNEVKEADSSATTSFENKTSSVSTQTVVAGTFLSLALVFGGVWFVRSKPSKTVVGLFLITILGSTTVLVFANIAPPRIFGINKNLFTPELQNRAYARGKVKIKIVDDPISVSDDFKLLVPKETPKGDE